MSQRFPTLREANVARQKEWDQDNRITLSFRGNELAGEVGEACNVIKKLDRERLGIAGSRATKEQLAEELADVVICADLIAMHEGIDLLGEAVPAKFNATTAKVGLSTLLAVAPDRAIVDAPLDQPIVAWWPLVKLDEYGDPTDEIVGGQWVVTEWNGGCWLEPLVLNAVGSHLGDEEEYADAPQSLASTAGKPAA
ncbi:hypothetical protein N185_35575 [Sinorhizobium sp. GW3]|nr:hypothetical protein N185_35575 [Sinorhizobium sp. GW3]